MLTLIDGDHTYTRDVQDNSPSAEPSYRVRFYFDPNSLAMNSAGHALFVGYMDGSPVKTLFRVVIGKATNYQVKVEVYKDNGTRVGFSSYTLTDAPHAVVLWWHAASGTGNNDGALQFWLDGTRNIQKRPSTMTPTSWVWSGWGRTASTTSSPAVPPTSAWLQGLWGAGRDPGSPPRRAGQSRNPALGSRTT